MAPGACGDAFQTNLTGVVVSIINYHLVPLRKSRGHRASLCLGEKPSLYKCLDLRYSFEAMVNAEYGGRNHLHVMTQNYVTNVKKEESGVSGITYEKALRNLIVTMYGHYINLLCCHFATAGHRCLIAYNCLEVAVKLGCYHHVVRHLEQGKTLPDWLTTPEIPADDPRKDLMDAFTQLGDPMHPIYGHPKILARGFDHIYHEAREMGQLPLRSGKSPEVSHTVYIDEYAQVVNRFSTLSRVNDKCWVRPVPFLLARPEIIYPGKMYEAYSLKKPTDDHPLEMEPTSTFTMDGLRPRIDVRPEVKIPEPLRDRVDEDPRFNTYPEFIEGDDWTPGHIPPQVHSPEYRADNSRDLSSDTEAALTMQAMMLDTAPESSGNFASGTAARDARRVELAPLPGIEQGADLEKEIQRRIQQESHRLVRDVLKRSAGLTRPPPSLESARVTLGACLERALAATCPSDQTAQPPLPPTAPEFTLTNPFQGINPPPLALLTEALEKSQHQAKPSRGCSLTRGTESPGGSSGEKRCSNSHQREEVEAKRGWQSKVQPAWDISNIGSRKATHPSTG